MPDSATSTSVGQSAEFFPVNIDSIDERALAMDLYLRPSPETVPVLYRSTGVAFTIDDRRRLSESGVDFLYVPLRQQKAYQRALGERLDRLFADPEQSRIERGRVIRTVCTRIIEDVMCLSGQPQAAGAVAEISKQFVRWSSQEDGQFSYLLDMSSHDFYTATHMVNVGVACGLLVRELRPDDIDLQARVVEGGLLHDIGKRGVPEEVLNKEGKLDREEWELIRKHPLIGFDELRARPDVADVVLEMTRDHHERLDGSGYPNGLIDEQIGFAARVCAVADVFDAVSASRPYRGPTPPLDTLAMMREGSGTLFDGEILNVWGRLVDRLISQDPARAVPAGDDAPQISLGQLAQRAPDEAATTESDDFAPLTSDQRRRYPRFSCVINATASFLRQGKLGPVKPGEWVPVRVVDVSRGGAQLRTSWPMSLNDVLALELQTQTGQTIKRRALVVRVRMAGRGEWTAGVRFLSEQGKV